LLGAPTTLVVTIQDRSTVPVIFLSDASVVEGNTGSTTDASLTFRLSAATGRAVSVNYATANIDATGGTSCSNQGTDYETTSGTISFQPGNTTITVAVKICGDTSGEANETFIIDLSNASNATVGSEPFRTIIDDDPLDLLFEESGPTVDQVAALDAFSLVRDPFRVVLPDWFPTAGTDRNTRVMFFVRGLQLDPGELPSDVFVSLFDSNNLFIEVPAEDVRSVPGVDFAQVVVRLPEGLAAGTCRVAIRAHGRTTNVGKIRIAP
jgi:Calx-beta domain